MASTDVQEIKVAADLALRCARLDMPRLLQQYESDPLMDNTFERISKLSRAFEIAYIFKLSSALVKQTLLLWALMARRAHSNLGSHSTALTDKMLKAASRKKEGICKQTARNGRVAFPQGAVTKIVNFVGDARVRNPMTATLASALSAASDRCNEFVEDLHVDIVLQQVDRWWRKEGGSLVVDALDSSPGQRGCTFSIPAGLGESLRIYFQQDCFKRNAANLEEGHREGTHILRRIVSFFEGSPYCYKVACSENLYSRTLPKDIYRTLQAWKRANFWPEGEQDILSVPNSFAAFMVDNEVIQWTLEW